MPSSISNFKRRLRLPRLFFRKPSQLESVHGGPPLEYVRPIPQLSGAPPGTRPLERADKAVRRSHTQTPAQRASQYFAMPLEEHVAFLKQEELTLDDLLKRLPIPNRPYAQVQPRLPPYFGTLNRERRARMIEECARPGSELAKLIQEIWIPLFTPQPPPTSIP